MNLRQRSQMGKMRPIGLPTTNDKHTASKLHSLPGLRLSPQERTTLVGALFLITGVLFLGKVVYLLKESATGATDSNRPQISFTDWNRFPICRYDGHCPVGSTCAVPPSFVTALGVCEPIALSKSPKQTSSLALTSRATSKTISANDEACFEACKAELDLDEHYYQYSWPESIWNESLTSVGRPAGCAIVYKRTAEGNRYADREPDGVDSYETDLADEWFYKIRLRHVIRVDPYDPSDPDDDRWMAYCLRPCQSNADCATHNDDNKDATTNGFVCEQGVCQRNPAYWERNDMVPAKTDLVVVTGLTGTFYGGVCNLAASLRYWAPKVKLVVYNLGGLSEQQKDTIRSWENCIALEWPDGVPNEYPPHVSVGKIYAWKPIIIKEALLKYKTIFWLDGGSVVVGLLDIVEKILHRTGIVGFKGQDGGMQKSHPAMYEWFNVSRDTLQTGPHFSGGTQASMYPGRYFDTVIAPNAACAIDKDCICPEGSNLRNHRYDQTSFSILAYMPKVRVPHQTELLAASVRQLPKDRKLPAGKRSIWTARGGDNYYYQLDPAFFPYKANVANTTSFNARVTN